jgi:5-methylthioadenosine/S-adenosylhomocysteine deaminase
MEPVFLKNCLGIIGLANGLPSFLEKESVLYDRDNGLSYKDVDKTGFVIDCQRSLLLQSFFNSHTHAAMTLFRNLGDDSVLQDWLSSIWELEARLTPELVRIGSEKAIIEFLLTGTTGFLDMYFYELETARVAEEYDVKIMNGPTAMWLSTTVEEVEKQFVDYVAKTREYKNVKPVLNLHSIYTLPQEFFKELGEKPVYSDPVINIHVSETKEEVISSLKKYGVTPLVFLDKNKLVSEKSVLVHLGWITSEELEIVGGKKPWLVHCPAANMKLATGGFFPLKDLLDRGYTRILLGTDGAASNDSLSMLQEARLALLLARNNYWSTRIRPQHVLSMAWRGWELYSGGRMEYCITEGCLPDLYLVDIEEVLGKKYPDRMVLNPLSVTPWTIITRRKLYSEAELEELSERNRQLATLISQKVSEIVGN